MVALVPALEKRTQTHRRLERFAGMCKDAAHAGAAAAEYAAAERETLASRGPRRALAYVACVPSKEDAGPGLLRASSKRMPTPRKPIRGQSLRRFEFFGCRYLAEASDDGLEVKPAALTAGYWPAYPEVPLKLPPALAAAKASFEAWYFGRAQGRRLAWHHGLERCLVRAT